MVIRESMTEDQEESLIFNRIREWDDTARKAYSRIGIECRKVYSTLLWKRRIDPKTEEPCRSFSRWIELCAPWGFSTCHQARRECEALKDIPDEHLAEIPQSNFETMLKTSTAVRADPLVLAAAKTMHAEELVPYINKLHPEQHLEGPKLLRFRLSETEAADVEDALRIAMDHGAANRNEALWALAIDFKASAMLEEAHAHSEGA